jgi:tetratricopeptide (TPR) repeat protein
VKPSDAKTLEVVTLRSRVLNQLGRHGEASDLVEPLMEEDPRNPVLLSLLAETRLLQERGVDAQVLIDRALGENARFAPALYVRGRSIELGGNVDAAVTDYETAIRSDPTFARPLSRLWGLYLKRKETGEAMATLERLLFMGEATQAEKVELLKLYVDTGANLQRARTLVNEALRREPKNKDYLKLKGRIDRALAPKKPGIIIMKHR